MAYCQKSHIQNYLMINIADAFNSQIEKWVTAVSRWIDNFTGTTFEQESATSKLYDGDGTRELLIDDLLTLTRIETLDEDGDVDETLDDTNQYYLYPANKTPKYRIRINAANAPIAIFPKGHQNIRVVGTFGHTATVPEDIRLATTMLVAQIIRDGAFDVAGNIDSERLGEYSVSFKDIDRIADRIGVKDILEQYRIIRV